jgi:hypothetical protein
VPVFPFACRSAQSRWDTRISVKTYPIAGYPNRELGVVWVSQEHISAELRCPLKLGGTRNVTLSICFANESVTPSP